MAENGEINEGIDIKRNYIPICALSPYIKNNWCIKIRVVYKDVQIKTFNTDKSNGVLFGFVVMDNEGSSIRITAFNELAKKFFKVVQTDKIYVIAKGKIKGNKYISQDSKVSDFAINVTHNTTITLCPDDENYAKKIYNFVKLNKIVDYGANEFIDVVGCIKEMSDIRSFTSKNGKEVQTRKVELVDETASIELTIWNEEAKKVDEKNTPIGCVVILPRCRISAFGGRSLSSFRVLKEDVPDKDRLEKWWASTGGRNVPKMTSKQTNATTKFLNWMESQSLNMGIPTTEESDNFKGHYFKLRGTIVGYMNNFDKPPYYLACPEGSKSLAKVTEQNGKWYCEKNGESYDNYQARFILPCRIGDFADSEWVSTFNDVAEDILGCRASAVEKCVKDKNNDGFDAIFSEKNFMNGTMTIRARQNIYEDVARVRYDLVDFSPKIDHVTECRRIIGKLLLL